MIRRRPIPRTRSFPEVSQHFDLILDGAVRLYRDSSSPDGKREVCQDSALGRRIYTKRVQEMVQRQNYRCTLCGRRLALAQATFEHMRRRGAGGARRDDRILDGNGEWLNAATHFVCNSKRG